VETPRIGDIALTHDGEPEQIIWIGHGTIDCARHPKSETVWPVRIAAGAFGPGLPARDMFLSPDHAAFVDGVLVPAKLLINGATITRVKRASVTYHHIELSRHAVILAERLTVESYLDTGDRARFAGGEAIASYPAFVGNSSGNSSRAPGNGRLRRTVQHRRSAGRDPRQPERTTARAGRIAETRYPMPETGIMSPIVGTDSCHSPH
jgi:collagen type I/II/III/V/XI/XXIV/XXVII alpha